MTSSGIAANCPDKAAQEIVGRRSPRPKKILVISTVDLTPYCFLRSKFKAMLAAGYDVTLACTVQKFRRELEETGIKLVDLPIERRISPLKDLVSLYNLIKLIRRLKPDMVHTHTSKAGFLGRLAAFLCRVPIRVHTIHELPENSTDNPLRKQIYRFLEWLAAKLAHFHFTVSTPNFKQITEEGICRPEGLAIVREGCLEPENFQTCGSHKELCRKLGFPEDAFIIGSAGRLERAKGHNYLIEAFSLLLRKLPPERAAKMRLVITGKGGEQENLQRLTDRLGLSNQVVLAGWVENLNEYLANYDVYALASLYEGLGIANMQAMALKRPVVCTGVGGVLDVIDDGLNGLLVPPADSKAMAEALEKVCTDPALAQRLAEAGYEKVKANFQEKDNCERLLYYYHLLFNRQL
ncbi:glycosyltransferase family 4 protein [bacterium]|nr:glycosyltransferase family 4 protein [bacterium]